MINILRKVGEFILKAIQAGDITIIDKDTS
jgi:hypothetical protein